MPDALKAPGLRLDADPPTAGLMVHVGVAAGQGVGVSSGTLRDPAERTLQFFFGEAHHLVELECVTAPGAAGAPVVDTSFAVRGFIVAGDHKERSYMYPSYRWAGTLKARSKRSRRPG